MSSQPHPSLRKIYHASLKQEIETKKGRKVNAPNRPTRNQKRKQRIRLDNLNQQSKKMNTNSLTQPRLYNTPPGQLHNSSLESDALLESASLLLLSACASPRGNTLFHLQEGQLWSLLHRRKCSILPHSHYWNSHHRHCYSLLPLGPRRPLKWIDLYFVWQGVDSRMLPISRSDP